MTGCNREKTCSACCVSICPLIEAICIRFIRRDVGERVVQGRRGLGFNFRAPGRCRREWRLHRPDRPQGRTVASSAASRQNSLPPTVLNRRFIAGEEEREFLIHDLDALQGLTELGALATRGSLGVCVKRGGTAAGTSTGDAFVERWADTRHAWLYAFSAGREPRPGLVVGRGGHEHEQFGRWVGGGWCRRAGRSRVAWSV